MPRGTPKCVLQGLPAAVCLAVASIPAECPAAPPIRAWSTGIAIHAERTDRPGPLWPDSVARAAKGPASTEIVSLALLLPRRSAEGRLEGMTISEPAYHAGRVIATVTAASGSPAASDGVLFAADCSDAAQGRVEWTASPPEGTVAFEGPPWIEGEQVLAVVVGEGPRALRLIARFDLFNGRHLATTPRGLRQGPRAGDR